MATEPTFVQVFTPLLYSGINGDDLKVYLILLDRSWKTGFCWISDRTIGTWLNSDKPKSQDTVSRILKRLEARGLVSRTKVEPTVENPTGRLITVNGRVTPYRNDAARGAAKRSKAPAAPVRHNLRPQNQENRPIEPVGLSAGEQDAQLLELAAGKGPLARLAASALKHQPHRDEP